MDECPLPVWFVLPKVRVRSVKAMRYTRHNTLKALTNLPKSTLCLALLNSCVNNNDLANVPFCSYRHHLIQ